MYNGENGFICFRITTIKNFTMANCNWNIYVAFTFNKNTKNILKQPTHVTSYKIFFVFIKNFPDAENIIFPITLNPIYLI